MGMFTGLGAAFSAYRLYFIGAAIVAALFAFGGLGMVKNHYKSWGQGLWSANEAKQIKIDAGRDTVQAIGKVRAEGDSRQLRHIAEKTRRRMDAAFRIDPVNGYYTADELDELGGK